MPKPFISRPCPLAFTREHERSREAIIHLTVDRDEFRSATEATTDEITMKSLMAGRSLLIRANHERELRANYWPTDRRFFLIRRHR